MTTLSNLTTMDRRRERQANEPGRYDVMRFVWSVPLPHPHMKVFSTPTPPPNEMSSYVSLDNIFHFHPIPIRDNLVFRLKLGMFHKV